MGQDRAGGGFVSIYTHFFGFEVPNPPQTYSQILHNLHPGYRYVAYRIIVKVAHLTGGIFHKNEFESCANDGGGHPTGAGGD